jgi:hypothetical protein
MMQRIIPANCHMYIDGKLPMNFEYKGAYSMYLNGQLIFDDFHFKDHCEAHVPVQIYWGTEHSDIGFVEQFCPEYIKINNVFYNRRQFTFVSRPGY